MSELRCNGCRANLSPADETIKFITCEWCRETNKNPNFTGIPSPTTTQKVSTTPKNQTINNPNSETIQSVKTASSRHFGRSVNKWVSFVLCFFLGYFGAHKFYEGKITLGFVYLVTFGLFGIGWLIDLIIILCKPNPYYVNK